MLQRKVKKKIITLYIVGVLVLTSPFNYVKAQEISYQNLTSYSAYAFFNGNFHLWPLRDDNNDLIYNFETCTQASVNNEYCQLYQNTYTPLSQFTDSTALFTWMGLDSSSSYPNWTNYSAYDSTHRIRITREPIYIVFYSSFNMTSANIGIYGESGSTGNQITRVTNNTLTQLSTTNYYLIVLKVYTSKVTSKGYNYVTVSLPGGNNTLIMPLYYGPDDMMSDELYYAVLEQERPTYVTSAELEAIDSTLANIYWDFKDYLEGLYYAYYDDGGIHDLLSWIWEDEISILEILQGNNSTNQTSTDLTNQSSQLDQGVTSFNNLEDTFNTNFTTDFNNIPFNNNMLSNSSLVQSMSWVRTQFDRMTQNNVFGTFIQYALLFGLGLLVIGLL